MKRLHRTMIHKSSYLEIVPLGELMEDLCGAINSTRQFKPNIDVPALTSLWNMKTYDGLRNRVQYLVRRKRGQWAALIKKEFIHLFLPTLDLKGFGQRANDLETHDDDIIDCDSSSLSRDERFQIGLGFMIDRVRASNGTSTLRLSKTPRCVVSCLFAKLY